MTDTRTQTVLLSLLCAGLILGGTGTARAQTALKLDGVCEKLVVAGRDLTGSCGGTLVNGVARGRASFAFTAGGETVSFTGNGSQQDATEETDQLQPINAVIAGQGGAPILAIGACRFSRPEPGRTAIACEANAADGRSYAGTFVTRAGDAAGAPPR